MRSVSLIQFFGAHTTLGAKGSPCVQAPVKGTNLATIPPAKLIGGEVGTALAEVTTPPPQYPPPTTSTVDLRFKLEPTLLQAKENEIQAVFCVRVPRCATDTQIYLSAQRGTATALEAHAPLSALQSNERKCADILWIVESPGGVGPLS